MGREMLGAGGVPRGPLPLLCWGIVGILLHHRVGPVRRVEVPVCDSSAVGVVQVHGVFSK